MHRGTSQVGVCLDHLVVPPAPDHGGAGAWIKARAKELVRGRLTSLTGLERAARQNRVDRFNEELRPPPRHQRTSPHGFTIGVSQAGVLRGTDRKSAV